MYCYSNNGISWRLVDPAYTAEDGEVLFPVQATPQELSSVFPNYTVQASNAVVLQQIANLEALQTNRMIREASANSTLTFKPSDKNFSSMTSSQALALIETKIATLRATLV